MRNGTVDVSRLERASAAFYVPLRMKEGFNQAAYTELLSVLRDCRLAWAHREEIPKRAANVLVGLSLTVEASGDLYSEEDEKRIRLAADKITELVRACVSRADRERERQGQDLFVFVPRNLVANLPPNLVAYDVSSKAKPPFVKLSPFYPHGLIPVPGLDGVFADSVEGIWQGLKVFDRKIDESYFKGKGKKRRGVPEGHRLGDRLLGYVEARKSIYIPSYEYMWRMCIGQDLRSLFFERADQGIVQYFYDYDDNGDPEDPRKPLAHSSVLVRLLSEDYEASPQET